MARPWEQRARAESAHRREQGQLLRAPCLTAFAREVLGAVSSELGGEQAADAIAAHCALYVTDLGCQPGSELCTTAVFE